MDIESERERAEKKLGRDNVRKESGFERDREKIDYKSYAEWLYTARNPGQINGGRRWMTNSSKKNKSCD